MGLYTMSIILSIKPIYCTAIYSKKKTVELRKAIGKRFQIGEKIYIYTSSPVQAITGVALIKDIQFLPLIEIKNLYQLSAGVSAQSIDDYFADKTYGYIIELEQIKELKRPVGILEISRLGFNPPQSFCYASEKIIDFLTAHEAD